MNIRKLPIALAIVLCLCAVYFLPKVWADTLPPEIANGLQWLASQVQADGVVTGEDESVATTSQARLETHHALSTLGTVSQALRDWLSSPDDDNTEYMARRALQLGLAERPDPALLSQMATRQNRDGGFGPSQGHASLPLDTAFALLAYQKSSALSAGQTQAAIDYLGRTRRADGGWGPSAASKIYDTAMVIMALDAWSQSFPSTSVAAPGRAWLMSQRVNGRYGDLLSNAVGLMALSAGTADTAVIEPLVVAVKAEQAPDGSWAQDPYLTALALRALWFAGHPPEVAKTGGFLATVLDAATSQPLVGATVQIIENTSFSATTDGSGKVSLSGLPPASYTVRFSKLGYETRQVAAAVQAGSTVSVGSVLLRAQTLTASLSGTVKDGSGNPLRDAIVSVGTATTLTDTAGRYELSGLNPGSATISASKVNYNAASATLVLEAGRSYVFSPALYSGSAPTTATVRGKVVDAGSSVALAGATVTIGNASKTTAANGTFEFTALPPGNFTMAVSAVGYTPVTASGALVAGVNDAGQLALTKAPQTSQISGRVTDAASGNALPGATVTVVGPNLSATTGADGRFTVSNVQPLQFQLAAAATGYQTQTYAISLTAPGVAAVDFKLTPATMSSVAIESLRTGKSSYEPSEPLEVYFDLLNGGSQAIDAVVDAQVIDAAGRVALELQANARGAGATPPNLPMSVPAGADREIRLEKPMIRQVAGQYTVLTRVRDTSGRVLAEKSSVFTVLSKPVLRGGVGLSPPLAQANATTPIAIKADLLNFGNAPIPAGNLRLQVSLVNADTDVSQMAEATVRQFAAGTPLNRPRGMARDAANNLYVGNASDGRIVKIDPQGVSSVYFTFPSNSFPSVRDLAYDTQRNVLWVAGSDNQVWSISPQLQLTEVKLTTLNAINGLDVSPDGGLHLVGTFSGEARLVRRDTANAETVLWSNGLSTPYGLTLGPDGQLVVANSSDGTLVRVDKSTGKITRLAAGLKQPVGVTLGPDGNFYVATPGDSSIIKVTSTGDKSVHATGLPSPNDLKFDASGNLFVSTLSDHSIYRIASGGGTPQLFARGVAHAPAAVRTDANGTLYIANNGDGTLRVLDTSGGVTTRSTGLGSPRGMAVVAPDDVLVANYSGGTVNRITGGTRTAFATGLLNPYGVVVDAGLVYVSEYGRPRITAYALESGAVQSTLDTLLSDPRETRVAADGAVFIRNQGGFVTRYTTAGAEVFYRGALDHIAPDPVTGGLVASRSADVFLISPAGQSTKLVTLPFSIRGVGVMADGRLVVGDGSARRAVILDRATGAQTPLATFTNAPRRVTTDLEGTVFASFDYQITKVALDGSQSHLVASFGEYIYDFAPGGNGRIAFWTNYARLYSLDTVAGTAPVKLRDNFAAYSSGGAVITDNAVFTSIGSANEFTVHTPAMAVSSVLNGFDGVMDIQKTGASFKFTDSANRLFDWTPGSAPVRLATGFTANYLAVKDGVLHGASGATVSRWTGSRVETAFSIANSPSLTGLALAENGQWYVADNNLSRLFVVSGTGAVQRTYAGIVRPSGMAFDAQNRLLVASNGTSGLVRFPSLAANTAPDYVARISSPNFVSIDATGNALVSASSYVYKVTPTGTVSEVGPSVTGEGVLAVGDDTFLVARSEGTIKRYRAGVWQAFASGLSTPYRVKQTTSGELLIANQGNSTLVGYQDGYLTNRATALPSTVSALAVLPSGRVLVAGASGVSSIIDAAGVQQDLRTSKLVASSRLYGAVARSESDLILLTESDAAYQLQITEPAPPPPVGTVVHSVSVPTGGLTATDEALQVDFGSWLPPYGGDFKFDVSYEGVEGSAQNMLHVGSFARGTLAVRTPEVGAGDQSVQLSLKLTGADFTSISRVDTTLVRRVINNEWPYGMVGDKSGAIWYTTSTGLKKTQGAAAPLVILANISPAYGLAVDAQERFYLPVRNSSGNYDLVRVLTDGSSEVLAPLGVNTANGVGINSRGEVFVGSTQKLLKVDPVTRQVSTFTTLGVPSPLGVAIDGRDNIYVQNNNHVVTLIKPDGTVQAIYDKGDGKDHPFFEGDGYPTITADCADNFYIAPYTWEKIGQSGEEHTLAQVVARTGRVSALFNGLQISSTLSDIDYLAYDRFGSRILLWNHYGSGEIWQVPVTCGAIGVEAHVITQAGQTLQGFDRAPNATIPLADGRTEYVWSLRDVTSEGLNIGFETLMKQLSLGETRPAVDSAHILFKNSFAPEDVKVPLDVPGVTVGNLVKLGLALDKPQYEAGDTTALDISLQNPNGRVVGGELAVRVTDERGQLVAEVLRQGVTLASTDTLTLQGIFPVGTTAPGAYFAQAVLSENGTVVSEQKVGFKVLGGELSASARSTLTLDKVSYNALDTLRATSRAYNSSTNMVLEDLTVRVRVVDAAGTVLFEKLHTINQLVAGNMQEFATSYALKALTPGSYRVEQAFMDASGRVIDTRTAPFSVLSSALSGTGLQGTLTVTPKDVSAGEPVALAFSVDNLGNDAMSALALKVSIVDPAQDLLLAELPYQADIQKGGRYSAAGTWNVSAATGSRLVAVLSAQVAGKSVTLAQDVFTVVSQPVKLDVSETVKAGTGGAARVLVLYDCDADMGWDLLGWLRLTYTNSCYKERQQYLANYLGSLKVGHYITYDREAFRRELRSGAYNTVWMLGALPDCSRNLLNEVREAVNRGATLLLDGGVTAYENHGLYRLAGARYGGHLWLSNRTMDVSAAEGVYTGTRLTSTGMPLRLPLAGGKVQASYPAHYCYRVDYDGEDKTPHPAGAAYAAVVSNTYGKGKAVALAFDLISTLRGGTADAANWKRFINETVGYLTPADEARALVAGEVTVFGANVVNQAGAVSVRARMALPSGSTLLGTTPQAVQEPNNRLLWNFDLAAGATQALQATLRAPLTTGTYSVSSELSVVRNGQVQPYATKSDTFAVADSLTPAKAALQKLYSLNVPLLEALTLLSAKVDLDYGIKLYQQGRWHDAIEELGEATSAVRLIGSTDLSAERLAIDRLMQDAQYRWYLQQPK